MRTEFKRVPVDVATLIVSCLEDAFGDDIRADIQGSGLRTHNNISSRMWDIANTNLMNRLPPEKCSTAIACRGPWEMLLVYDKETACILTIMREKRFAELQRQQIKRDHMHYLDMLAKQFNTDLLADQEQLCFYPKKFKDEGRLPKLVQTLLRDLEGGVDIVRHHILVLFDTAGYQLTSVRAVMVTPSLEIVQDSEEDWCLHISNAQSAVVEQIDERQAMENDPNHGLKLKPKAMTRKSKIRRKEEDQSTTSRS